MRKLTFFAIISLMGLNIACKNVSSENQGYDSGPTTESESGSPPSSSGEIVRDSTAKEDTASQL